MAGGMVPQARLSRAWAIPLVPLVVGVFLSVLDTSIVNVALPAIGKDFGADTEDIEWVNTAYTLTLGVVVPFSGWLGDRVGLTRVYVWSLAGFAIASGLCGLAWDLNSLIAFRIVQAVPGSVLPVAGLSLVYRIVPREQIGTAMGMFGLGVVFAPASGPTLGGYLVEYQDWRLIFDLNVPIATVGAVAAAILLPSMAPTTGRRFDWWGFWAIATGLFALLLAFSKGQDWGWTGYRVLGLLVGGLLLLGLFVVIELQTDAPLFDLEVLRCWPFMNSLIAIAVLSVGLFAMLFYLPIYLQNAQGIGPLRTGLLLLPEAVVMGVFMPISGLLYDRIGPRWPVMIGFGFVTGGTYLLAGINADMTNTDVIIWTVVRAVGNGLAMMPIMTAGIDALPPRFTSSASALNNIVQRVSAALTLAALTSLATRQQAQLFADRAALAATNHPVPHARPFTPEQFATVYRLLQRLQAETLATSYSEVFLICSAISAIGVIIAITLRRPSPQDTHTQDDATDRDAAVDSVAAPIPV